MEEKNQATKICVNCGKEIQAGEEFYESVDGIICEDCYMDDYDICNDCGKIVKSWELYYVDNESIMVCDDCVKNYFLCADCGEYFSEDNIYYIDETDYYVCGDCFNENYGYCDNCGDTFRLEHLHSDGDCWYCEDCYDDNAIIRQYHSDRNIEFFGNDKLYMGIELEVDKGNDNTDTALYTKSLFPDNYIFFERDGSLDDGYENITQPATYDFHMGLKDSYSNMFSNLVQNGYSSHNTSTCGLHIHINKNYFTDTDLGITKILYIVEKFWDNLVKFSRRNQSNLNRWASRYETTIDEVVKGYKDRTLSRYHAVNLTNRNTIEFRLFRGTLNIETFIATIQLVYRISTIAEEMSIEDIQNLVWEDLLQENEIISYWDRVKDR